MQSFFALKYILAKGCAESGNYNHLTFAIESAGTISDINNLHFNLGKL